MPGDGIYVHLDLSDIRDSQRTIDVTNLPPSLDCFALTYSYSQSRVTSKSMKARISLAWKGSPAGTQLQTALRLMYEETPKTPTTPGHLSALATAGPGNLNQDGTLRVEHEWDTRSHDYTGLFRLEIQIAGDLRAHMMIYQRHLAVRNNTAVRAKNPHDVCISFPSDKRLYASSSALKAASPYFVDLLTSGFSEGSLTATSGGQPPAADAADAAWDGCDADSDYDTDVLYDDEQESQTQILQQSTSLTKNSEKSDKKSADASSQAEHHHHRLHYIKPPGVAFTTYRAVLIFLLSGHIEFAPLLSTHRVATHPASKEAPASRHQAIRVSVGRVVGLPVPASPKSVYRLARLLQLDQLERLALREIGTQLTVENVAYELFSDVAGVYEDVREMLLQFAVENWAAVKDTASMQEMEALAEAGELPPNVAVVAMRLAKRLVNKSSAAA